MERNNKYDKYFSKDMTPKQTDITFFKLIKNTPEEDVKDLFDAWSYASNRIFDRHMPNENVLY